jgi:SOS response regulatory protein OraA/RecX
VSGGDDAFEAAARSLRVADRSRAELEERLARRGVGEAERAEALERLERLGWLDDARPAAARAAQLAGRGYGDAYIRADLARRRLPLDGAFDELEPEPERAARHASRGAAWLARRGFDPDVVDTIASQAG